MEETKLTLEIAKILADEFERNRITLVSRNPKYGDLRFSIGSGAPNVVAIKLPENLNLSDFEVKGINYIERMFNLIKVMLSNNGIKITHTVEFHIYKFDGEHFDAMSIFPKNVN